MLVGTDLGDHPARARRRHTVQPAPTGHDPEFHPPHPTRLIELDHAPEAYLRLVANPFLGGFVFVVWLASVIWVINGSGWLEGVFAPLVILVLIVGLFFIPFLFQYHCLDCGATGRLSR